MAGRHDPAPEVPAMWADTVEAPRAGIVDPDRARCRTRFYRFAVWTAVVTWPFVFVLLFVVAGKNQAGPAPASHGTPVQMPAADSPGRAAATVAVQKWLRQDPAPLPGASVLSWDGATRVPSPPAPAAGSSGSGDSSNPGAVGSGIPEARYETDTFTLVTGSGAFWDASVEVAADSRPGGGAAPVTGVSITPVPAPAADGWDTDGPWPGAQKSTSVSGAVGSAVQSWATAWTSGNPGTLAQAVQDPSPGHAYLPVSGVATVSPSVLYAAPAPGGQGREMVEVSLGITWDGQAAPGPGQQGGTPTVMDLLVAHAGTPAPVVVAWGPPGSGPSLKPYQNAVDGTPPAPGGQGAGSGPSKDVPAPSAPSPAPAKKPAGKGK